MPADRPNVGTGRRRQHNEESERSDDRNRALIRALEEEQAMEAAGTAYEPHNVPGASGATETHQNIKPGTRLNLEQTETRRED